MSNSTVIGAVIIARHGDRSSYYQDVTSYSGSDTTITPLGDAQQYQLGQMVARTYINASSETAIPALVEATANSSATNSWGLINSVADIGGEGTVIYDSAVGFWQGVFPPSSVSNITLANGTSITSPLGGYQYVQVAGIKPVNDPYLEAWTGCDLWNNHSTEFYASDYFAAKETEAQPLLDTIQNSGLVGGRTLALKNMWNIFDFINVNRLHNATFLAALEATGDSTMPMVTDLANWHEYHLFTDSSPGGIGNIAGRTLLPRIINLLDGFTNSSVDVRLGHMQMAYKPFLSIMNMTNISGSGQMEYPEGVVDYASAATFELHQSGDSYTIRFGLKNGTADGDANGFTYYPLYGSDDIDYDYSLFKSNLDPYLVKNVSSWCDVCNSTSTTCSVYNQLDAAEAKAASAKHYSLSPAAAGSIGFAVTFGVMLGALLLMYLLGFVSFGRKGKKAASLSSDEKISKA